MQYRYIFWRGLLIATFMVGCGTSESTSSGETGLVLPPMSSPESGSPLPSSGTESNDSVMDASNGTVELTDSAEDDNSVSDGTLNRAFAYLLGHFDSSAQALLDPTFFNVQLKACQVSAPELGERVLYIEQAMSSAPDSPYRQRLYVVDDSGDGRVASTIYTVANEDRYVGLCDRSERVSFNASQVTERSGCTVFLTAVDDYFTGGTEGEDCRSTLRGASYATSKVSLFANRILSWDQGFNASNVQVWGAVSGAYEFLRARDTNDTTVDPLEDGIDEEAESVDEMTMNYRPESDADFPNMGGETCEDAPALAEASIPIPAEERGDLYRFRVESGFGRTNDYNPLRGAADEMAPSCALVYDALGRETVFSVFLRPGDTLSLKLTVEPRNFVGGMYMLDGCESPSWPDLDGSGACGSNEYASHGNCFYSRCESLEWSYRWPIVVNGQETEGKRLYLVIDEVAADRAEHFVLDWAIN